MNAVRLIPLLTLLLSPALAAAAPDGKQLYQKNCTGCHDTRVHTRPNRILHVYSDLVNRVKFCDAQAKTNLSEAQLAAITEYLNSNFYKFIKD